MLKQKTKRNEDGQFGHVQNVWLNELQSSFLFTLSGINIQSLFFLFSMRMTQKVYPLLFFSLSPFLFSSLWSSLVVVRERKRERKRFRVKTFANCTHIYIERESMYTYTCIVHFKWRWNDINNNYLNLLFFYWYLFRCISISYYSFS